MNSVVFSLRISLLRAVLVSHAARTLFRTQPDSIGLTFTLDDIKSCSIIS